MILVIFVYAKKVFDFQAAHLRKEIDFSCMDKHELNPFFTHPPLSMNNNQIKKIFLH